MRGTSGHSELELAAMIFCAAVQLRALHHLHRRCGSGGGGEHGDIYDGGGSRRPLAQHFALQVNTHIARAQEYSTTGHGSTTV